VFAVIRGAPYRRLEVHLSPQRRAAVSMVTSHLQPDPRVGRPGRESNPVHPCSHDGAVIQTQGAVEERLRMLGDLVG
jgi:hypothetical protein